MRPMFKMTCGAETRKTLSPRLSLFSSATDMRGVCRLGAMDARWGERRAGNLSPEANR
jgi:hypothetical protein